MVALGALALAIVQTWPLATSLASAVPNDVGDPILNTWILWRNASHVPFTEAWWNAPIFFPATGIMAFSEHLLGLAWLSSPVIWLTGSPLAGYNVAFLAMPAFAAATAYMLGYELTGRRDAAILAAAAFAFAPYRAGQLAHLQVLASFWMPLALWAAHRHLREGGWRWVAVFALAFVGQGLSNGYFLAFFPVLMAWWSVWHLRRDWRRILQLAAGGALGAVLLLPLVLEYSAIHARYGLARSPVAARLHSADAAGWLDASPVLALWGWLNLAPKPEGHLFPGAVVVALTIIAALLLLLRRTPVQPAARLLACYGPGAVVMFSFAMGPAPTLFGEPWLTTGPYAWLMQLPGFDALRVAGRFGMLMALCLAAAAAVAFVRLSYTWTPSKRHVAAAALGLLIVAEGWPARIQLWDPPREWSIEAGEVPGALLVLPIINAQNEAAAMYRAMAHGRPIVNGYSGNRPPWYPTLIDALNAQDPDVLDVLIDAGVTHVAIVRRQDPASMWADFVRLRGTLVRESEDGYALYALGPSQAEPRTPTGEALAIAGIETAINPRFAAAMLDANPDTFWSTFAPQTGGESFTIDLGATRDVRAIDMSLGRAYHDHPRELVIAVSSDGAVWRDVWAGRTDAASIAAAFREPARIPMTFSFDPQSARFVRLTQTGRRDASWTVTEVRVLGSYLPIV